MKEVLLVVLLASAIHSCDMKDQNGNAPLIEDVDGNLIDNPDYKTDAQISYDENMESARADYSASEKDDGSDMKIDSEPTTQDRERFAAHFKPKTSKNEISVSGKDKTTITCTGAFNTAFTLEQFENLNYFGEMKSYGFKKVIFSNGVETVGTREL